MTFTDISGKDVPDAINVAAATSGVISKSENVILRVKFIVDPLENGKCYTERQYYRCTLQRLTYWEEKY